jgi:DNA modification methylase
MSWRIENATPLAVLRELPDGLAQTCVTSPPQWTRWQQTGGDDRAASRELYVRRMVEVMREVRRVLRADGTAWVKLAEPRSASGDLTGLPWQVVLALQADGWSLRRDIVVLQRNPPAERAGNRPVAAHGYLFLLSKQPGGYYYDAAATRERPARRQWPKRLSHAERLQHSRSTRCAGSETQRSWWRSSESTRRSAGAFPVELVELCVLAGSAARACGACGAPYTRDSQGQLHPACRHHNPAGKSLVLDPFCGTGTTGLAARGLGRGFLGIEPSNRSARLARRRLARTTERTR